MVKSMINMASRVPVTLVVALGWAAFWVAHLSPLPSIVKVGLLTAARVLP